MLLDHRIGRIRLPFAIKSLLVVGALGATTQVQATVLFTQNFDALDAGSTFTSDVLPDGGALANAGASHTSSGGSDLGFNSFWFATRSNLAGPVDGSESGDFIGVNSFSGSNAPNTAADGSSVSAGSQHNFEFNDTDGRVDLVFDSVDLSAYSNRQVSFDYWVSPTGFESTDTFSAKISDDLGNTHTFVSLADSDLESAPGDDVDGTSWANATLDLESLSSFNFSALTLTVSADTNAGSENIFVDNILFESDAAGGGETSINTVLTIMQIQGSGYASAYDGQSEIETSGVVTQVESQGFFLQDPNGDGDTATSDGIYVHTGSEPTVAIGDGITLVGEVDEYFGATEITNVTSIEVDSTGNSIAPLSIGTDPAAGHDRLIPTRVIDDAGSSTYDESNEGRDFYESLEGMLVQVDNVQAVGTTRSYGSDPDGDGIGGSDREVYAIADAGVGASGVNDRGGITISQDTSADNPLGADLNPERILINRTWQDDLDHEIVQGDALSSEADGSIVGTVHYTFDDYIINAANPVSKDRGGSPLTEEVSGLPSGSDRLTVASYNVLNLDANDADGNSDVANGQFAKLADHVVNHALSPDIIGLQEVQDNSGSMDDGQTSASQTLQALVDAIVAAGGPQYAVVDNPFVGDKTNGGDPAGNIRNAYLYNPARVDLKAGSLHTVTDATDQQTDPSNPFYDSRLPLAATFVFNGEEVTLINNHFASKSGSDPLYGDTQPAQNGQVDQRDAMAAVINGFVEMLLSLDADSNVIVLGDLNEFQFYSPLEILANGGDSSAELTDLVALLADATDAYSYNFEGNSQLLDHILVTANLLAADAMFDILHVNSGLMYAGLSGSAIDTSQTAASDHDMLLASFLFGGDGAGNGSVVALPAAVWLIVLGLFAACLTRRPG